MQQTTIEILKLIAAFSTAIVAGVGIWVAYYNIKRQIRKNTTAQWIKDFRDEVSNLNAQVTAVWFVIRYESTQEDLRISKLTEYLATANRIKLMIDYHNPLHAKFAKTLIDITSLTDARDSDLKRRFGYYNDSEEDNHVEQKDDKFDDVSKEFMTLAFKIIEEKNKLL